MAIVPTARLNAKGDWARIPLRDHHRLGWEEVISNLEGQWYYLGCYCFDKTELVKDGQAFRSLPEEVRILDVVT